MISSLVSKPSSISATFDVRINNVFFDCLRPLDTSTCLRLLAGDFRLLAGDFDLPSTAGWILSTCLRLLAGYFRLAFDCWLDTFDLPSTAG